MFVFGTAGHIDHGKTALIYSLTSIDTDRLPEEKKRGMTIDLGFAWIKLASGETVGIVDVPGHENLIKNMIAGATGIDAVILVVDANEGWMPQTEEHFQIINLLNIKFGIIVISKVDLANKSQIDFVEEQIRKKIANSNFCNASIVKVSTVKNIGIDHLKLTIQNLIPKMKTKKDIGKPRLSIDRVFSMKGSGTIVTGTSMNGIFYKGMEVVIFPSYKKSRIRNLQAYKEEVKKALPGSRVAINLSGTEKKQLHRGNIIFGTKTAIKASKYIDAKITLLPEIMKFTLKNRANLDFFCGTQEILAKIILNEKKYLTSGEKALVQFRFSESMATYVGERFILRIPSPPQTIGGGIILDPLPRKHNFKDNGIAKWLQKRETFSLKNLIITELEKYLFIKKDSLLINANYAKKEIQDMLESLQNEEKINNTNSWLIDKHFWGEQIIKFNNRLNKEYTTHPLEKGFPLNRFQGNFYYLPPEIFNALIASQIKMEKIVVKKGIVILPDYRPKVSSEKEKLILKIMTALKNSPNNPPNEKALIAQTSGSREIINFLIQEEKIIKLNEGILLEKEKYDMMKNKLIHFLKINGSITIAEVRTLLGLSRKYIIPLLTKMDEENITQRQGNQRILKVQVD